MAATAAIFIVSVSSVSVPFSGTPFPKSSSALVLRNRLAKLNSYSDCTFSDFGIRFSATTLRLGTQRPTRISSVMPFSDFYVIRDVFAVVITSSVAILLVRLWEETAKRQVFEQNLNRKLVHITIGLAFMLCWPLFSSGNWASVLASLIPGVKVIQTFLIGLGIWKDEATVMSMSRFGDHRELLKGPLYYACSCALLCAIYWRTSPVAIAATCNLCAGDGLADIVGRRIGSRKILYNSSKSIAGSITMAAAGFVSSVGFMFYFSSFGFIHGSWEMVLGFLATSLVAAFVESLPIGSVLDDNLTVPVSSVLVESLTKMLENQKF